MRNGCDAPPALRTFPMAAWTDAGTLTYEVLLFFFLAGTGTVLYVV
jgi:hypothetical protein